MQLTTATRLPQKMRLLLQGDQGTGKTFSALQLAYGLTGSWSKIAVIDTENGSASFYSHLGYFNTLQLDMIYQPGKFVDAIELAEQAGMECIILDSATPEFCGFFGLLDQYCSVEGDWTRKWDEAMPMHHGFVDTITSCLCHIIVTVRVSDGKMQQEAGFGHHFTTVLSLDKEHKATVVKDRTGVLNGCCGGLLTQEVGTLLYQWCKGEDDAPVPPALQRSIDGCMTIEDLNLLLFHEDVDNEQITAFTKRRLELEGYDKSIIPLIMLPSLHPAG